MYSSAMAPSRHFATVTIRLPSSNSPTTHVQSPDPNLIGWDLICAGVPPVSLSDSRLRRLAAALGPAYVRVSGTWANAVYFHDSPGPAPSSGPAGFHGVLTRQQWAGVVEFAGAVDAELVTSFATSSGTPDEKGVVDLGSGWRLLACTKSADGQIAAAEFMNEPTYAAMGGAPEGYDAAAYGHDIAVFQRFLKQAASGTICPP